MSADLIPAGTTGTLYSLTGAVRAAVTLAEPLDRDATTFSRVVVQLPDGSRYVAARATTDF